MKEIFVIIAFILVVLAVNLAWEWQERSKMERELELWTQDLVEERNEEARGL